MIMIFLKDRDQPLHHPEVFQNNCAVFSLHPDPSPAHDLFLSLSLCLSHGSALSLCLCYFWMWRGGNHQCHQRCCRQTFRSHWKIQTVKQKKVYSVNSLYVSLWSFFLIQTPCTHNTLQINNNAITIKKSYSWQKQENYLCLSSWASCCVYPASGTTGSVLVCWWQCHWWWELSEPRNKCRKANG